MFGRSAVCLASVCALCSMLVAGEARALPSGSHRLNRTHLNRTTTAGLLSSQRQAPAWPPRMPSVERQAPRVRNPRAGARGGQFGNAFMVDTGVVLGPESGQQYSLGAASNGNGWQVLWGDENDYSLHTCGVASDGSVPNPGGSLTAPTQYLSPEVTHSIAATGSGFFATWAADAEDSIWVARLDSAGAPVDSFLVFANDSGAIWPAVAFDGDSTCLIAWVEYVKGSYLAYAARVTAGGHVYNPVEVSPTGTMALLPSVAFGNGVYLVTWTAYDTSTQAITARARRVSADGVALDTAFLLRHDPTAYQAYPAVAFGDTCFLAAWSEGLQQPDIYAARVSVSGHLIDTAAIRLCNSPTQEMYSSVGFDGTHYLVMWAEYDTTGSYAFLRGRRLTANAVPLDSNLIEALPGHYGEYPSVVPDHANFLVACSATDTLTGDEGVGCVRISTGGVVLDSGIFFPMGADAQSGPSGATDGSDFLAAWLDGSGISAARITANGTVLDPVGFPVDTVQDSKTSLAAGFGDSLYLVAWAEARGASGQDIYCARVGLDGHVLDPDGFVVCSETSDQTGPDVSFDGHNFLVAWQDNRTMTSNNICAARVSPAGAVLDPNGFVVAAADTFDDAAPAVSFNGTDHLIVWQGTDNNTGSENIYGALVSPAGNVNKPRFRIGPTGNQYQREPCVARGTANSLVAWVDVDYGAIYAARVRADGTVLDTNGLLVDSSSYYNELPHVTANAAGFKVLWDNYDMDTTRFAVAQIDTAGVLVRSGPWFGIPSYQDGFDAVYGSGPDLLLLFSCQTDTAWGHVYRADRLWGRLGAVPGIAQADNRQLQKVAGGATVLRGVLWLAPGTSRRPQAASLLDISGRKVMDLHAGTNDVSRLAPGVYFVREQPQAESHKLQAVQKVVIAK